VNDIDINQDVSEGRMDIEISYQNKSITSSTVETVEVKITAERIG
jgi:hypothetical protein